MLGLLAERKFPLANLRLFASARSAGKTVSWQGRDLVLEEARAGVFGDIDLAFSPPTGR